MKKIDVLWLIEHIAREMDVACAVKSLAKTRYGIDITIRNIYQHVNDAAKEFLPSVVVFPFLYRVTDVAIKDYVEAWPGVTYFNLAWEQVHYNAHLKIKAPADVFTQKKVTHHAWGNFYKNYLVESQVPTDLIFVNGHPAYQLYKKPYSTYFKTRDELAQQNGIDPTKKWIFIPENYKWAFFSDDKLQRSAERGGNLEEHLEMRAFCQESLGHVLQWCNEVGANDDLEIIFRPRPATNSQQIDAFFKENVGTPTKHLHITKAETVRDWILASDIVFSSYSTSLIEAAIAGKPIYMLEPVPILEALQCDWYDFVPRLHNSAEFKDACMEPGENTNSELQTWAQEEMLSNGDPISGLADFVAELVQSSDSLVRYRGHNSTSENNLSSVASIYIAAMRRFRRVMRYTGYAVHSLLSAIKVSFLYPFSLLKIRSDKSEVRTEGPLTKMISDRLNRASFLFTQGFKDADYFNPFTHENDEFTDVDIHGKVEKWNRILANS